MRRKAIVLIGALLMLQAFSLDAREVRAQVEEEDFLGGDVEEDFADDSAADREKKRLEDEKKRQEEERRRQEEEAIKADEAKRAAIKKQQLRDRRIQEERERDLDAKREAATTSTVYTLEPDSVKLLVEMDPRGYGFRTRAHRMTMSAELDLLLRGRGALHYDFRFFNFFSAGILAGVDWSDMSLYARFRDGLNKPAPKQFTAFGGLTGKVRLTEWRVNSSIFLEPSLIFGHLWQDFVAQKSTHWRLRPGIFGGIETVFDSGLATTAKVGVEFPFDFGTPNPIKEAAEPLFMLGLGFAI